jgi:hypothetical protein
MLKNNFTKLKILSKILKNHSAKLKLPLPKLKLQPDSIARQPHASFAILFAPAHGWHVLENFEKIHYRLFCSILPHVPAQKMDRRKMVSSRRKQAFGSQKNYLPLKHKHPIVLHKLLQSKFTVPKKYAHTPRDIHARYARR